MRNKCVQTRHLLPFQLSLSLRGMARRDRSYSPETSNKRVRPSHRSSPRSPSPTRRNTQRPSNRPRHDDRDREWDRPRDRGDRYHDDKYRDDRRRDSYRDSGRDDRRDDRRRSRSRERRAAQPPTPPRNQPPPEVVQTPPPEDDKLRAKRANLAAWKKEREAKKALDEAKAKAMALAGKSVPGEFTYSLTINMISQHLIHCSNSSSCCCCCKTHWPTKSCRTRGPWLKGPTAET